jgi:hypothetical protein
MRRFGKAFQIEVVKYILGESMLKDGWLLDINITRIKW